MATATSDVDISRAAPNRNRATNIAPAERFLSLLSGGFLTLYGLRRRAWSAIPFTLAGAALLYRGATGHSRVYEQLGVNTARPEESPLDITASVTIRRPPEDVYRFWREFENLPRLMPHLRSVERVGDNRYHWVAQPPAMMGRVVEWDTELIEERPDELLRWRTLPESPMMDMTWTVALKPAPGDRGTEVHVTMEHRPASAPHLVAAKVMYPIGMQMLKEGVRRSKRLLEAGEMPTIEGQSAARAA